MWSLVRNRIGTKAAFAPARTIAVRSFGLPSDILPETREKSKPQVGRGAQKKPQWFLPEGKSQKNRKRKINRNVIPHYQIKGVFAPKTRVYDFSKAPATDLKDVESVVRLEFPKRSRNGMMDIQGFIRMMFEERIISAARFHITDVVNIMMQYQYSNQYLNTKVTYGVPEHQKMNLEKAIMWAQKVKYHDIKMSEGEQQEDMRQKVLAAKEQQDQKKLATAASA